MNRYSLVLMSIVIGMFIGIGLGRYSLNYFPSHHKQPTSELQKGLSKASSKNKDAPLQTNRSIQSSLKSKLSVQQNEEDVQQSLAQLSSVNTAKGPPKTAKEVLDRLIAEMENADPRELNGNIIYGRLQQLIDFGEDGSKAILDFFQTNQDIMLGRGGFNWGGGGMMFPSLRSVLLSTLYEFNDPTAEAASLEVLKNTTSGYEAILAAKNLEKISPGVYRAEALKAVTEILPSLIDAQDPRARRNFLDFQVLEIVGYYQAREMIPQVEEVIKQRPELLAQWIQNLLQFPAEDQIGTYRKLLEDEKGRQVFKNSPLILQLDYQNSDLRHLTQNFFSKELNPDQKGQFLQMLVLERPNQGDWRRGRSIMGSKENASFPQKKEKDKIEGKLKLLSEIELQLDTPELKTQLEKTRQQLQESLQRVKE